MRTAASAAREAVKRCQLFSTLDDASLDRIAATVIDKHFEAGSTLFRQGESATELLVIQEGKVALQMELTRGPDVPGRRVTVDVVAADEIVGWSALVEPRIYTLTAVCLQDTRALSISGGKLNQLLQSDSSAGFRVFNELIAVMASRLADTRHVLVSERLAPA